VTPPATLRVLLNLTLLLPGHDRDFGTQALRILLNRTRLLLLTAILLTRNRGLTSAAVLRAAIDVAVAGNRVSPAPRATGWHR
jgi:hypothetical protein